MELVMKDGYVVKTEPYNWVLQKTDGTVKHAKSSYYGDFRHLQAALLNQGVGGTEVKELWGRVSTILNLNDSQTLAFDLTKAVHPHFSKKMNPNSLKNLKQEANVSKYMARARALAYKEALKAKKVLLVDEKKSE